MTEQGEPSYTDLVYDVLRSTERPLTFPEIFDAVSRRKSEDLPVWDLANALLARGIGAVDNAGTGRQPRSARGDSHARAQRAGTVYQLKVTLRGIRPPVWRRLLVPADTRLSRLHDILQVAMGWTDSHLHQFEVGRRVIGVPGPDDWRDVENERKIRLADVAPGAKSRLRYEYDFGDSWEHDIVVEQVLPAEPGVRHPQCTGGRRACPPEDVGGVWGYAEFLEAIQDPRHPEHEEMREWVGGAFDPEAFDAGEVNAALLRLR